MSGDDEINYQGENYNLADLVPPPPGITPDMVGPMTTWVEQLLGALMAAANGDDPKDIAEGEKGYAERQALTKDALTKFPENEVKSQSQLQDVTKLAEQMPQLASGLAGGLAGALGGALKPLTEMPQQLAQSIQGFLQQGMGATEDASGDFAADEFAAGLDDEFDSGAGDLGTGGSGGGGSGGGGVGAGTAPMSMLGPAATPNSATTPTAARASITPSVPAATAAPTGQMGGMGGYPMMPHSAMQSGAGADKDDKAATKKVSVPSVKNGAPVTGRVTAPPTGPTISKQVEGKTVATRRIVIPSDKSSDKAEDPGR